MKTLILLLTWATLGMGLGSPVLSAEGVEAARNWWAFQPMLRPQPPEVSGAVGWMGPIDVFLRAKLLEQGLDFNPPADPRAWLRRATLDLIGLPPTPEEMTAWVAELTEGTVVAGDGFGWDRFPEVNADRWVTVRDRAIERLLASPRHGERWAQPWLDLVRYADTHGFEVNTERPNAWPYRDYVIRALNTDVPYDRFVREQLAGDVLGEDAATGFLVAAAVLLPGQIGADDVSKRLARQDALSEIVGGVGQTFLGLSVGCARCHSHKFDPIPHRDYYAMQAFFAGVDYGDRPIRSTDAAERGREADRLGERLMEMEYELTRLEPLARVGEVSGAEAKGLRPAVQARRTTDRFEPVTTRRLRFSIGACTSLQPCLDELEVFTHGRPARNVALAGAGTRARASSTLPDSDIHRLEHLNDGRYGNGRSWISNEMGQGWVELEFEKPETIDRVVWGRDREGQYADRMPTEYWIEVMDDGGTWRRVADSSDRWPLGKSGGKDGETAGVSAEAAAEQARWLAERKSLETRIAALRASQLVYGGVFGAPEITRVLHRGDPEQPKEEVVPAVLSVLGEVRLEAATDDADRRRALADWLTTSTNPLTARVMVNRIWQGHFGIGLVETASDFGRGGTRPSHPELLDWLASEFVRGGWSMKHLHRLILRSTAYGQSSRIHGAGQARDADVRLLWRFPSRRMEAEMIRDSLLAVSGRLNLEMGGRGFDLFRSRGGLNGFPPIESFGAEGRRRMIYAHKVRMEPESVFGAFDCPDAGQTTPRRRPSTTPIQALNLFNSRFTLEESAALAARAVAEAGDGAEVTGSIRRAYRLALLREPRPDEMKTAESVVREHGLTPLCRALLNSNEFLHLP